MKMNVMMTMKVVVVQGAVVLVVVVHSVHVQAAVVQVVVVQVVGVQLVGVHSVVVHSVGVKVVAVHLDTVRALDAVQLVAVQVHQCQDMENVQNHLQKSWKLSRQRLPNWIHGTPRDVLIAWIQHLVFSEVIFKLTQINTCTNRDQLSYPDKIQRRKGQPFRHINLISNSQSSFYPYLHRSQKVYEKTQNGTKSWRDC